MFFTAVLRVAVDRFSADADVVKDIYGVHQGEGGGGGRGRPEKGRVKTQETVEEPQPIWGMLNADDAGASFPDRGAALRR